MSRMEDFLNNRRTYTGKGAAVEEEKKPAPKKRPPKKKT